MRIGGCSRTSARALALANRALQRTGVPRILWTVASIRAVTEGDADVHKTERRANPFDLRVH